MGSVCKYFFFIKYSRFECMHISNKLYCSKIVPLGNLSLYCTELTGCIYELYGLSKIINKYVVFLWIDVSNERWIFFSMACRNVYFFIIFVSFQAYIHTCYLAIKKLRKKIKKKSLSKKYFNLIINWYLHA